MPSRLNAPCRGAPEDNLVRVIVIPPARQTVFAHQAVAFDAEPVDLGLHPLQKGVCSHVLMPARCRVWISFRCRRICRRICSISFRMWLSPMANPVLPVRTKGEHICKLQVDGLYR
jgi:hypothetical protein